MVDEKGHVLPPGTEGDLGIRVKPIRPIGIFSGYVVRTCAPPPLSRWECRAPRGTREGPDVVGFAGGVGKEHPVSANRRFAKIEDCHAPVPALACH